MEPIRRRTVERDTAVKAHPILLALVALSTAFVLIVDANRQIYDSNLVFLFEATAMLAGDHPYRDFFEWGVPLSAYLSAGMQRLVGYRLIGEFLLQWLFVVAGSVISFHLAVRVSRSVAAALAMTGLALIVLADTATYHYPKLFLFPLTIWLAWRYLDQPSVRRSAVLGVTTAVAFVLGAVASRSSGIYFLMLTLVYGVIGFFVFAQVVPISGPGGVTSIGRPALMGPPIRLYYAGLILSVLAYVGFKALGRTAFGLALQGIRDDPVRMASLGFNVPLHRTLAFTLAGFVAGFAWLLNVWWNGQIDPASISIGPTLILLIIAVIGGSTCSDDEARAAEETGRLLATHGAIVVCGGLGGVMEAVAKGAKTNGGTTVGILPGTDPRAANAYIDIPLATGLGEMRNFLIVRTAQALIAIGGGVGTLSELALAQRIGRPVVGLRDSFRNVVDIPRVESAEAAVRWALERARQGVV